MQPTPDRPSPQEQEILDLLRPLHGSLMLDYAEIAFLLGADNPHVVAARLSRMRRKGLLGFALPRRRNQPIRYCTLTPED